MSRWCRETYGSLSRKHWEMWWHQKPRRMIRRIYTQSPEALINVWVNQWDREEFGCGCGSIGSEERERMWLGEIFHQQYQWLFKYNTNAYVISEFGPKLANTMFNTIGKYWIINAHNSWKVCYWLFCTVWLKNIIMPHLKHTTYFWLALPIQLSH